MPREQRNLLPWSRPRSNRQQSRLPRRRTRLKTSSEVPVLKARSAKESAFHSIVLESSRQTRTEWVSKDAKNIWTKKSPLKTQRTDWWWRSKAAHLPPRNSLYQSLQSNGWDNWKSSRIAKIKKMSRLLTKKVRTRLWPVLNSHRLTLNRTQLRLMKLPNPCLRQRATIKRSSRPRLKRRRTWSTSTKSSTSIPTSSTTDNSFAEKYLAQHCFWRTSATKSK